MPTKSEKATFPPEEGLSKREYLAAAALQGLLANSYYLEANSMDSAGIAEAAVEIADKLIVALNGV